MLRFTRIEKAGTGSVKTSRNSGHGINWLSAKPCPRVRMRWLRFCRQARRRSDSPSLCPSGPTDWDTRRFLSLGCNIGYLVECVDENCPKQGRDLRKAQERAWENGRNAID